MTTHNPNAASAMENQKEETTKKSYWVVAYRSISNESGRKGLWGISSARAVQSFGGRFFDHVHEPGAGPRSRIAAADSYDIALAAHESEAYQKALQALGSGADRDYRIVEGA